MPENLDKNLVEVGSRSRKIVDGVRQKETTGMGGKQQLGYTQREDIERKEEKKKQVETTGPTKEIKESYRGWGEEQENQ